jgi:D-3-phosphoglycerate dehydrogenase
VAIKLCEFVNQGHADSSVNFPQIALTTKAGGGREHRLLNVHRNVPGVLREINNVLSEYNIAAQVLGTRGPIGYLIADIDTHVATEVRDKVQALPSSIRTRVIDPE